MSDNRQTKKARKSDKDQQVDHFKTKKKPFAQMSRNERIDEYDAFTSAPPARYQQPPFSAGPLPVPDIATIHLHITAELRTILGNHGEVDGGRLLGIYRAILNVWLGNVRDALAFLTSHMKHHEQLLLTLIDPNCPFKQTETNGWCRVSMHNLNVRIDQLTILKNRLTETILQL